eukprot:9828216-Alexandrium_andersonii.AAC.1
MARGPGRLFSRAEATVLRNVTLSRGSLGVVGRLWLVAAVAPMCRESGRLKVAPAREPLLGGRLGVLLCLRSSTPGALDCGYRRRGGGVV